VLNLNYFTFSPIFLVFLNFFKMNIYIGNISYSVDEQELEQIFGEYGEVSSAKIIIDRVTGRSKGFGFVEMPNDNEGRQAIDSLEGKDVGGRKLRVNEARPRVSRY
jgi:RNA recognition motif-containing protein